MSVSYSYRKTKWLQSNTVYADEMKRYVIIRNAITDNNGELYLHEME